MILCQEVVRIYHIFIILASRINRPVAQPINGQEPRICGDLCLFWLTSKLTCRYGAQRNSGQVSALLGTSFKFKFYSQCLTILFSFMDYLTTLTFF